MTDDEIKAIRTIYDRGYTVTAANDIPALLDEIERLRAEAKRADEEATLLANSELATTEQVIRALRVENERLRGAVEIGMHYLKGHYPIPVKEKEVLAKMKAALADYCTDALNGGK